MGLQKKRGDEPQEAQRGNTKGLARLRRNQMLMMLPFGRNLNRVIFPSSQSLAEDGWLRHQENAAKPQKRRRRARSASAIARSRNWWSVRLVLRRRAELTTPSATNRNGSIAFDVADTPPLRGGECAPKTLSEKLKLTTLLHKEDTKGTKRP